MSQRHLYGTNYDELDPPLSWQELQLQATINDDSIEANINENTFFFVGNTAEFIQAWVEDYGVFNGVPYRIQLTAESNTTTELAFDGYLDLTTLETHSKFGPIILQCTVQDLNNNPSVFDKMAVLTQTLLRQQGFITPADFVDVPIVKVSKKGADDRIIALSNLGYTVISTFTNIVQNFFSAIADILGLSAAIGLVELLSMMLSTYFQIQQLIQLIIKNKDLLIASQTYYKAIGLKTVLVRAFEKLGYPVDFGTIEPFLDKVYLKSSENDDFLGAPSPGTFGEGTLKTADYGWLVLEALQTVKKLCNTREGVINGTVWVKTKTDPDWNDAPAFQPEDVLVESTKQYKNGIHKNKVEEVYATTILQFQYDPSDAWTLTANSGDSHEVHRELITELNPRMNTLKGLQDIQINYAMAVRYDPVQTLIDLIEEVFTNFSGLIGTFQDTIDSFSQYLDPNAGAGAAISDVMSLTGLNFFFAVEPGGLKVEDDSWGIPKIIYADNNDGVLNIPVNFKDFIGAPALYNNYYFPDSPAEENGFRGQKTLIEGWRIPFNLAAYQQTKLNPYFNFDSKNAKFTHINWTENSRSAETEAEIDEIFDKNIKETVILL
jgi:hypothetical protein